MQKTLVVIEDDATTKDALIALLEAEGYYVIGFEGGKEALQWLQQHRTTCIILLDVVMRGMNGMTFMEEYLKITQQPHPVYFISAACQPESLPEGVIEFIKKPIIYDELIAIVERHCHST